MSDLSEEQLRGLSRRALQAVAKKHGVKANQKSAVLIEELLALDIGPSEPCSADGEAVVQAPAAESAVEADADVETAPNGQQATSRDEGHVESHVHAEELQEVRLLLSSRQPLTLTHYFDRKQQTERVDVGAAEIASRADTPVTQPEPEVEADQDGDVDLSPKPASHTPARESISPSVLRAASDMFKAADREVRDSTRGTRGGRSAHSCRTHRRIGRHAGSKSCLAWASWPPRRVEAGV